MNFITKLSKSKKSMTKVLYDSILIITDRLTKYCYFLAYRKKSTAKDLTYTFLKTIESQHELSKKIISDKNKLFTFRF